MLGVILSYSILRKVGLTMSKTTFCICMILMLVSSFCALYFSKKLDDSYSFKSYLEEFSLLDLIFLILGFPFILITVLIDIFIYILDFLDSIKFF